MNNKKKWFLIQSENGQRLVKLFEDSETCYHYIVNNLDLSLNWKYEEVFKYIEA